MVIGHAAKLSPKKTLFSLELSIDPEPIEMQIPRMYLERYSLRLARLGMSEQGRFIVAEPKELPSVISARWWSRQCSAQDRCSPGGNLLGCYGFRLMRALSSEGIAYIRDERMRFCRLSVQLFPMRCWVLLPLLRFRPNLNESS